MRASIFSNVITGRTPAEAAAKTRSLGLSSVQFVPAYVNVGFGFDQAVAGSDDFAEWAEAYRQEDIEICGVAGYVNLLHPDKDRQRRNIEALKDFLRRMAVLGTRYISTETGSYATTSDWDFDPQNRTLEAWDELRRVTEELVDVAAAEDAVILYEPYIVNVCHTPELGAKFVREFDSPHLAMLMDPTNWFENELVRAEVVQDVIRRGFEAERGLFRLAHAKDVAPPEPGSPKPALPGPGKGILDYATYVTLLREHEYDGPLVIEHLTEEKVPEALQHVQYFIDEYG
jgi:sugar phosphate isomerase/epimerase